MTDTAVEKPMTATERKALEKLIDGDFDNLLQDLQSLADRAQKERIDVVVESFAPRSADVEQATKELTDLTDDYNDKKLELDRWFRDTKFALVADWKEKGVIYDEDARHRNTGQRVGEFTFDGLEEAKQEVRKEVQEELKEARRVLQKERTNAQREVLLGGLVSSQARALVEAIPSAQSVFTAALAAHNAAQEVKELTA